MKIPLSPDDKPRWDTPSNVASQKVSQAGELALKHKISVDRAQMLIDRYGAGSDRLDAEAVKARDHST